MAGNRQQFTLQFNADTSQAKKAVQELSATLNKITHLNYQNLGIEGDIKKASDAALELQQHLNAAMNTNTGKLDLGKFASSLKSANTSVDSLVNSLLLAGTEGQNAIIQMANAVGQMEVPIKKTNQMINNMMTTLKNTVKWELSSSFVHGIEGALSSAVSYTKNLNTSLTNIRIVTGQSADDMARFAVQANKAAKELSTTTKAYADASLIYYQQGDSAELAAKKAAITLKAANASFNTSAAEMSEYLTSVWNSYQVGASELEHYVDIMAALGAKTATSLEEIATSMQKVAATSNTVGVSMEQVSSIIATVSSVTRESAESIGTSYKTIFARIGDLKLGETLEDGINLGQVSSELDKIGIKILDTNGEMRDMGTIIEELGSKWQDMSRAEQTAIAQVVAGKRQYTQLMALFENWDMYQNNMNIASNANGELESQARIYEESWKAAADRTQAALEQLYGLLLNEKALIGFQNALTKIVEIISGMVSSFGGVQGILVQVGAIALRVFEGQIKNGIASMVSGFKNIKTDVVAFASELKKAGTLMDKFKVIKKAGEDTKLSGEQRLAINEINKQKDALVDVASANESDIQLQQVVNLQTQILDQKKALIRSEGQLSEASKETFNAGINGLSAQLMQIQELRNQYKEMESSLKSYIATQDSMVKNAESANGGKTTVKKQISSRLNGNIGTTGIGFKNAFGVTGQDVSKMTNIKDLLSVFAQTSTAASALDGIIRSLEGIENSSTSAEAKAKKFAEIMANLKLVLTAPGDETFIADLEKDLASGNISGAITNLQTKFASLEGTETAQRQAILAIGQALGVDLAPALNEISGRSSAMGDSLTRLGNLMGDLSAKTTQLGKDLDSIGKGKMAVIANAALKVGQYALTAVGTFQTMANTIANWDPEGSMTEKAGAVMSTVSSLVSAWSGGLISGIVGTVATVVGAIIGVFEKEKKRQEEWKAKEAENYEKYLESLDEDISDGTQEAKNNQQILASFTELLAKKREGQAVDAELSTAARDLAESYNVTGVAIAELSGDYDQLAESAKKAAVAQGETALKTAESAIYAAKGAASKTGFTQGYTQWGDAFFSENLNDTGRERVRNASANGYGGQGTRGANWYDFTSLGISRATHNNTMLSLVSFSNTDWKETTTTKATTAQYGEKTLNNAIVQGGLAPYWLTMDGESQLLLSENDTFEYREQVYKAIEDTLHWLNEYGLGGTEFASGLSQIYSEMKVDMDRVQSAITYAQEVAKEILASKAMNRDSGSYDDFSSLYEELYTWAEQNKDRLGAGDKTGVELENFLHTIVSTVIADQTAFDDYLLARDAIFEQFATDTDNADTNAANTFYRSVAESLIRNYGPEAITPEVLKAIGDIEITDDLTPEEAAKQFADSESGKTMIAAGQAQGQTVKQLTKQQRITQASEKLKENMTGEESMGLYNSLLGTGVGWDAFSKAEDKIAAYNKFLAMTYEEQQAYFTNLSNDALIEINRNAQTNLKSMKSLYDMALAKKTQFVQDGKLTDEVEEESNVYRQRLSANNTVSFVNGELKHGGDKEYGAWLAEQWAAAQAEGITPEDFIASLDTRAYKSLSDDAQTYVDIVAEVDTAHANLNTANIEAQTAAWNVQNIEVNKLKANIASLASMISNGPGSIEEWNKLSEILGKPIDQLMLLSDAEMAAEIAAASTQQLAGVRYDSSAQKEFNSRADLQAQYGTYDAYRLAKNTTEPGSIVTDAEYAEMVRQNQEIQAQNATIQFESQTQAIETAIDQAEDYANVLNNLNLDSILSLGTKEWRQLTKIIGKTKEEFLAMSKIKQIELIGQSQIDQLNAASQKYSEMATAATTQRDKFTKGSEEWLAWEERRLSYQKQASNTAIEAEQVNADILSQKVEVWDSAFSDAEARVADLREQTEKLQDKADILSKAILSGELSAQDKAKFSQKDLQDWDQAGSAAERAAIATKAWSDYAAKVATDGEALTTIYGKAANTLKHTFTDDDKYSGLADKNKYLDYMKTTRNADDETLGAISKAWDNLIAKGVDLTQMNNHDITEALKTELIAMGVEVTDATTLAAAMSKDAILEVYADLGEQEQALAAEFVDIWEQAFKTVASLRSKILMGEDIMSDLTSSFENFNQIANSYTGGTDALVSDFKAGKVDVNKLDYGTPEEYATALKRERGADFFALNGKLDRVAAGRALGITQSADEDTEAYYDRVEQAMRPYLESLLEGYDLTGTGFDTVDELINSYFENGWGGDAWDVINAAADKIYANADKYAELVYAEQAMLEAKQTRDAEMEENTEKAKQADAYAEAADSALSYNRGEDTSVTDSLTASGINLLDFAQMANQVLGRTDLTAENLDQLTDDDLNAIYTAQTEAAQKFYDAVTAAADAFLAKFTGDGEFAEYEGSEFHDEATEVSADAHDTGEDYAAGINAEEIVRQSEAWEKTASSVGMAKDEFQALAQYLYETAGYSGELTDASQDLQNIYRRLAKEVTEVQNAWDDLTESQAENIQMIKKQEKANAKYPAGLKKVTKDVKKIFGDSEKVTEAFVEEHIDLIEKMVQGDLEAAEELEGELLKDILGDEKFNEPIKVNFDVDHDGVVDQLSTVGELLNNFGDEYADKPVGFTVDVDDSAALAALSDMATNGTLSAEQIQAAFDAIGWAPQVEVEDYTLTEEDIGRGYVNVPSVDPITGKVSYEQHSIDSSYQAGQTIQIPRIGKATKKPGGASSKPSSNKPSGGGGGGGSKPKKLDKKDPEDHKERYHETNQSLERLADELEKVDKLKSRAYGKGHLDAIKQEISLLKQEIGLQQDYIKQAQAYLKIDRNRVASLGAMFNADGTISNYDELIDSIVAKYNAFIDKYNAASASAQEDMEEEKEKMDEWFDEAMEWISQYEDTLNIIRDKENEILELQNEISSKTLEGIQYKVEFEVELNQEEVDFLDYLNEKYGEVLEKQDILVENLIKQQQLAQENLGYLNNAKAELDAKFASGELNQADYVAGLQDINDQILENLSTLEELRKEIQEAYGNALEMATEAISNHTEKMEHASQVMQSYISIMGLIGKGVDYDKLSDYYDKQYNYNLKSLETQQQYLEVLKEEESYYLAKMAAGDLTETERIQFEALQDTIAEVEDGILSKTEETLSALREAFAIAIEGILRDFEESVAGSGNTLEDLAADYEYYLEVQERHVSTSKELYEISKLNRQIEQDIAESSSSLYKQRLAALQEEIKAKSADRALTEYDIQMMNLEYELLQRQMALEEAKNAKDTVRLTRDSSGNMVYQYTADQDKISEAQQGVEDVLQQMAEANAERVTQLEQETINTYQNMVSQIEEIANSEVLTQEEKNAKIAEIVAQAQEKMLWLQDQYGIATENTMATNALIQDHYNTDMITNAQISSEAMNETIAAIINKSSELSDGMATMQEQIGQEMAELEYDINTVLNTTAWDDAGDKISTYDQVVDDATGEVEDMIAALSGEEGLLDSIKDTTAAWDAQSAAIDALIDYYEDLYTAITQAQNAQANAPSTTPGTPSTSDPGTGGDEPEEEEPAEDSGKVQFQGGNYQFWTYKEGSGTKGKGQIFHGNGKSPVVTKEDESSGRIKISGEDGDGHSFSGRWISKTYKKKDLWKAYETGGLVDYTGPAWVDGTKENPELMLNATDTQNMLAAVQTVRALDGATLSMLDEFIKLATSCMLSADNLHASGVASTDTELQQQVQITAEFPNVQDSNEIQDAFDNLINRAAQYIGSKK